MHSHSLTGEGLEHGMEEVYQRSLENAINLSKEQILYTLEFTQRKVVEAKFELKLQVCTKEIIFKLLLLVFCV
jgi:hypothetical protein